MRLYELNCLISPEITKEEINLLKEKLNSLIQNAGGILEEATLPVKRRLSYPIKKTGEILFWGLTFCLATEKMAELEKELKSEKKILRYLILFKKPQRVSALRIRRPIRKLVPRTSPKEKKAELKEIDKKLEEILDEQI